MFDFEDPTLDCLPPAPLFLDDYSRIELNALGMRYKLVILLVVMPLGRGLMDMAHLGQQHIESTRFATGNKNWLK